MRIEAVNRLPLLHDADAVAGDDFHIFAVMFEKMDFALTAGFLEFFCGEGAFFFGELGGERAVAGDFGIECRHGHGRTACDDQGDHHSVGLVPDLGVFAAFGADGLHGIMRSRMTGKFQP